jgi:hypothetical protein
MRTYALGAQELTRRLVANAAAENGAAGADVGAYHRAGERACRELSRSLGAAGFNVLLTRALAQAESAHPLLKDIKVTRNGAAMLGGIPELVETHGAPAVAAGLEAMLSTIFGLLGRLIGDDMVPRLIENAASDATHDDEEVK